MQINAIISDKVKASVKATAFEEASEKLANSQPEVELFTESGELIEDAADNLLKGVKLDDTELLFFTQEEDLFEEMEGIFEAEGFIKATRADVDTTDTILGDGAAVLLGRVEDPELDEDELDEMFEAELYEDIHVNDDHAIASMVFFEEYFEFELAEDTRVAQLEAVENLAETYRDDIYGDFDAMEAIHQLRTETTNLFDNSLTTI